MMDMNLTPSSSSKSTAKAVLAEKLFAAIKCGLISDAEKYLHLGADPNRVVSSGHSPFHFASGCERSDEFVRLILKHNGNPNVRNCEGQTPLHIATLWGKIDCIKLLAGNGADLLVKDNEGRDLREFAKENGSAECLLVVETLIKRDKNVKNTPRSTKQGPWASKDARAKRVNRTPDRGSPATVLSPLHNQYDDSWIVKDRGSAKRRRNGGGKTSRDNSPASSPIHGRTGWTKSHHPDSNKTVSTDFLPTGSLVHLSSPSYLSRSRRLNSDKAPSDSGAFTFHIDTANFRNISEKSGLGSEQQTHCGCHHMASSRIGAQLCGGAFILTPINGPPMQTHCLNCCKGERNVSDKTNTTDKCVGTSVLNDSDLKETSDIGNTDSAACQVAICEQSETIPDYCKVDDDKPSTEGEKCGIKTVKTSDVACGNDALSLSSAMSEFLKGCDGFVVSEKKGLDVSSPDHCVSFTLGTDSNTDPLETPRARCDQNRRGNCAEKVVQEAKDTFPSTSPQCEKPFQEDLKTVNDSFPCQNMLLSTKVPLSQSEMKKFYNGYLNESPEGKKSAEDLARVARIEVQDEEKPSLQSAVKQETDAKRHCKSEESVFDGSDIQGSTLKCGKKQTKTVYHSDKFAENMSDNTRVKEVITVGAKNVLETVHHNCVSDVDSVKSDFTFSESTVPLASHYKSICESPSTPENHAQSSISLKKFSRTEMRGSASDPAIAPEKGNRCDTLYGSSPEADACPSVLLRTLAAKSSRNNENKSGCETTSPPSDVSQKTAGSRLHSTALNDTHDRFHLSEDDLLDISIIKANGDECLMLNVKDETVFGGTSQHDPTLRPKQMENETYQSSSLQLSLASANASSQTTIIYNWKAFWKGEPIPESAAARRKKSANSATPNGDALQKNVLGSSPATASTVSCDDPEKLSDIEIRNRLVSLGHNPGPIAACRSMYVRRLKSMMQSAPQPAGCMVSPLVGVTPFATPLIIGVQPPKFSTELHRTMMGVPLPDSVIDDDDSIRSEFEQPDPKKQWREGTTKNSFTYLLLDPRVTDKLPIRARLLSKEEAFRSFVGGVFYVGKGRQSRPYSHFHEARQTDPQLYKLNPSRKVRHIHDIWQEGHGVISLHVFQSVVACEAYTREASIIDTLGLDHLTNLKRGDYYGTAATWTVSRKRTYGAYLLRMAMDILMVEGERQIRPSNLRMRSTRQR